MLAPAFYEASVQIIPVLLLAGVVELVALVRPGRRSQHFTRTFAALCLSILIVMIVGEISALWVVATGADRPGLMVLTLYGLGAAGSFAIMQFTTDLEGPPDHPRSWRMVRALSWLTVLLPFVVATVVAVVGLSQ